MKLRYWLTAAAFAPCAAFAEGSANTLTLEGLGTQLVSTVESMVPTILYAIGGVVAAVAAFWGVRALIAWVRGLVARRG